MTTTKNRITFIDTIPRMDGDIQSISLLGTSELSYGKYFDLTIEGNKLLQSEGYLLVRASGRIMKKEYRPYSFEFPTMEALLKEANRILSAKYNQSFRLYELPNIEPNESIRIPFEVQMNRFKEIGLSLNKGINTRHLLQKEELEGYEYSPYKLLLYVMSSETETNIPKPLCSNLWLLDTECIYQTGDYKRLAKRMEKFTLGDLKLENIKDKFNSHSSTATLSFTFKEENVTWDFNLNDDWLDLAFLNNFADLIETAQSGKHLFVIDPGEEQDFLLLYMTSNDIKILSELTGERFEKWIDYADQNAGVVIPES